MKHKNKVILIGNLGGDPEVRYLNDGNQVVNFSMATTEKWTDKAGTPQERTEWHRVVAFRKLAEICATYLAKGRAVYLEGKLQTRKWQGQDGQDRYTTEIVADEVILLPNGERQAAQQPSQTANHSTTTGTPPTEPAQDLPF